MRATGRVAILAAALAGSPAFAAEDAGAALRACRAERDDARRLACYDGIADGSVAPVAAPPATPQTTEEKFGLERAAVAEETRRHDEAARELGRLEATVTAIEKRIDGLMTITLDNGQVWRQNMPDSKFSLKTGDPVLIQPGSLKSYILSGPTKKSTRVTRVK